ncbi:hypothetical protein [Prosthecobacter fusiformis]|nr:hypothetical protein [Prosthecobacter fusiformis]
MIFISADVVALSRAVLCAAVVASVVSCAGPQKVTEADAALFDLPLAERKARFPQVQNVGVVELSGARMKTRAFKGAADEKEYLATGGALLVKKVDPPILAQAPEILVTPDAAILKGRQAMVKHEGRLITGGADSTEIVIDGTQVNIEGPHSIRNLTTGKTILIGAVQPPVEKPAPQTPPAQPEVKIEPKPVVKAVAAAPEVKSVSKPEAKSKSKPQSKPVAVTPEKTKPAPAATPAPTPVAKPPVVRSAPVVAVSKPVSKPAATPPAKPVSKPAPQVDRKELLNLMREPSE